MSPALSTFSARSISMSSSSSASGLWTRGKSPSVYGGAGGYGIRVSRASTAVSRASDVVTNEKETMKNLNDRLASYLEKVRSLESHNRKLELQIREHCEKRTQSELQTRDYSAYFALINDLRNKISVKQLENQSILFKTSDAQLAADDFKVKGDKEMALRSSVEADVSRLCALRDNLTLTRASLELHIQGLAEELVHMKKSHQEEMLLLREQQSGSVNVEVDSAKSVDLTKVLSEMRQQYETLMEKNKSELKSWFLTKVETLKTETTTTTVEASSSHTELSELRKTYQSYEISRDSLLSQLGYLHQTLEDVQRGFGVQLTQIQLNIDALEAELQQLRLSMETQRSEYSALLDLKMRLELEIEEYRRLLGVELEKVEMVEKMKVETVEKKTVIISQVEEKVEEKVEERKPHIERRIRTIVEELVDGVVVNHKVDTQIEDIQ